MESSRSLPQGQPMCVSATRPYAATDATVKCLDLCLHPRQQRLLSSLVVLGRRNFGCIFFPSIFFSIRMLTVDPAERITAEQALQHPWVMSGDDELAESQLGESLQRMRDFNARR